MFQTKVVERIRTHILCSETRAVDEIMWKHTVQPDMPQMTVWRMHIAFWISKATNTRSEYVIIIASPLQHWLHERASVERYTVCCGLAKYNST